ncbi:amidase [Pseudooceanicola sp. LIPI14-2-Ac024]|uniref:amidase n=1 Tax=Pseudooceanicola sp. LIPI14-2-Ac024 TaxID=3344875 RepID=UPI0035D0EFC9
MQDRLTATAISEDVRARRCSARDVAKVTARIIAAREPEVQAFAYFDPDLLLAQADAVDEAEKGPLAGVTVAVKDVIATADMPTGYNNTRYSDLQSGIDAACVDTLRQAGAVMVGKSVTTEFAATQRGGKTRNPHDLTRTPGGSSSGSAAAVAAGMCAIGLGTQTGGSTIRPASYNGIWGWKPTWGVISREGLKLYSLTCDTLGLYARDVADFDLLAEVYDLDRVPEPDRLEGLRIGVVHPPAWDRVEPPMRAALEAGAAALAAAGAEVAALELPDDLAHIDDSHATILAREGRAAFLNEARAQPGRLHDEFRAMVENRGGITAAQARAAYRHADLCRAQIDDVLAGCDAILAPSAMGEAPVGLETTGDAAMNSLWTLLGLPVVSVPGHVGPNGMPLGLSVICARYDDRRAIRIGALAGEAFARVRKSQAAGGVNSGAPAFPSE